jgi:hypothetical protein
MLGHALDRIDLLRDDIADERLAVVAHPLYEALTTRAAVVTFMEHHVWAVWDFMSLLKSLQRGLTGTSLPWLPTGDPHTRRLINEIVLDEESDRWGDSFGSHFELYLAAMAQAGADTEPMSRFIGLLRRGAHVGRALAEAHAPASADAFVSSTWGLIRAPMAAQAAAFAFGREDVIPQMFEQIGAIDATGDLDTFRDYLARHVELDEHHGELALRMVEQVCGTDDRRWELARESARAALRARLVLWNGTLAAIR